MKPGLREAVLERAGGTCECGCGQPLFRAEIDHAFGRARAEESLETCWALTPRCHFAKTNNSPSAAHWLTRFEAHAEAHGYFAAAARARTRLFFVNARTALRPRFRSLA